MDIAYVLYDDLTALDVVGPYEALGHPSVTPRFVADRVGPVRADNGLVLHADTAFADLPRPDVIVVPGSSRFEQALLANTALVEWLAAAHPTATRTASVCSGSTLLAKAGVLAGRSATTHWAVRDLLASLGAVVRPDRVVRDGSVITAAGVSAGIDLGLVLAAELWGDDAARLVQLLLEYDPEPPFDSGSPEKASPETLAAATALLARRGERFTAALAGVDVQVVTTVWENESVWVAGTPEPGAVLAVGFPGYPLVAAARFAAAADEPVPVLDWLRPIRVPPVRWGGPPVRRPGRRRSGSAGARSSCGPGR
ncbi:MAG TPA: DJ-1/PfpI family protein [Actinophytocola sp.]|nr:DJ-1/PfpI family protein [Actinophytocola sp.]